jgi:hypothetical protein
MSENYYTEKPAKGVRVAAFAEGLKGIALLLLELAIIACGVYLFATGQWIGALLLWFLLAPFIAGIGDLATGILLSPLFGLAYLMGWRGE